MKNYRKFNKAKRLTMVASGFATMVALLPLVNVMAAEANNPVININNVHTRDNHTRQHGALLIDVTVENNSTISLLPFKPLPFLPALHIIPSFSSTHPPAINVHITNRGRLPFAPHVEFYTDNDPSTPLFTINFSSSSGGSRKAANPLILDPGQQITAYLTHSSIESKISSDNETKSNAIDVTLKPGDIVPGSVIFVVGRHDGVIDVKNGATGEITQLPESILDGASPLDNPNHPDPAGEAWYSDTYGTHVELDMTPVYFPCRFADMPGCESFYDDALAKTTNSGKTGFLVPYAHPETIDNTTIDLDNVPSQNISVSRGFLIDNYNNNHVRNGYTLTTPNGANDPILTHYSYFSVHPVQDTNGNLVSGVAYVEGSAKRYVAKVFDDQGNLSDETQFIIP